MSSMPLNSGLPPVGSTQGPTDMAALPQGISQDPLAGKSPDKKKKKEKTDKKKKKRDRDKKDEGEQKIKKVKRMKCRPYMYELVRLKATCEDLATSGLFYQDALDGQATAITFLVPEGYIPNIAGEAGQHVNDINRVSGAMFNIDKSTGSIERKIHIKGAISSVCQATAMMCLLLAESTPTGQIIVTLLVPEAAAGSVVGRGGTGLKLVRQASMTQLDLQQSSDLVFSMRRLTVQGLAPKNIACACYRIIRNPGFCRSVGGDASVARTTDDMGIANPVAATMATPTGLSPTQKPNQNPYCQKDLSLDGTPIALASASGVGPLAGPLAMAQQTFMQQLTETNPQYRPMSRILVRPSVDNLIDWISKGVNELEALNMWQNDELDLFETQAVVLCPEEFVGGMMLDDEESGLNMMSRNTGADFNFQTIEDMEKAQISERRVILRGQLKAITVAIQVMVTIMAEMSQTEKTTMILVLDHANAGLVVGKGGAKLKEIRESSGTRINLEQSVHPAYGGRRLTIIGTGNHATYAAYQALRAIHQKGAPRNRNTGGGPRSERSFGAQSNRGAPPPVRDPSRGGQPPPHAQPPPAAGYLQPPPSQMAPPPGPQQPAQWGMAPPPGQFDQNPFPGPQIDADGQLIQVPQLAYPPQHQSGGGFAPQIDANGQLINMPGEQPDMHQHHHHQHHQHHHQHHMHQHQHHMQHQQYHMHQQHPHEAMHHQHHMHQQHHHHQHQQHFDPHQQHFHQQQHHQHHHNMNNHHHNMNNHHQHQHHQQSYSYDRKHF